MKNEFTRMQKLAGIITENKQPGDVWKATSPMMKIKLLKRLGVEDEATAKKYAETYKDKSWAEVKKAVSDLTIDETKSPKMTKSELKAKIKEMIMAETSLDEAKKKKSEDEVNIDDEDITINPTPEETPAVATDKVDANVKAVQDALTQAQAAAEKLGDKKLTTQIGNTITFFTRAHVVEPGKGETEM